MLPFRVEFSERAVADIHRRLDAARWSAIPFATDGADGPDDSVLRGLARHWRAGFDWFAVQARLNRLAHLRGPLGDPEGELHCVLFAPAGGGAAPFPLLLLRGWPGSFLDALPAAGLLAAGAGGGPPFEVVVPSLPGLGFSDAPPRMGMHPGRAAGRMHDLMRVLGYERYGVHGDGEEGAAVASRLAEGRPEAVAGLHLGSAPPLPPPAGAERSAEEDDWRSRLAAREREEDALAALEAARPRTLAYALQDSPLGLLAWLLDRSRDGRGAGGGPPGAPDRDALLANATLHWLTGSALAAARARLEARREQPPRAPARVEAPTAFAPAPGDPLALPAAVLERGYRLVRRSEPPRGALEPLAEDIAAFFGSLA